MIAVEIPTPGVYLHAKRVGNLLPAVYVQVHGVAACGGPYIEVTFDCYGARKQRRVVRIAVDNSWRGADADNHGLLLNCYGEAIL